MGKVRFAQQTGCASEFFTGNHLGFQNVRELTTRDYFRFINDPSEEAPNQPPSSYLADTEFIFTKK
jgi:hypothetical protein